MSSPDVWRGTGLAVLAAVAFGASAPIVAHASADAPTTAAVLYAGSAAAAATFGGRTRAIPRDPRSLGLLAAMVLSGAVLAPIALAWGLPRTGATTGSLLLNLEAAFTVMLAAALLREHVSRRVMVAVVLMTAGGITAALEVASGPVTLAPLGAAAVALACLAWATDNVLARKLGAPTGGAALAPLDLVLVKGALGAAVSASIALSTGAAWPGGSEPLLLLGTCAVGYGLSLYLYLKAQPLVGAARTGSVFSVAPFIGALASMLAGDRAGGWGTAAAALLFAVGVAPHGTERSVAPEE